MKKITTLFLIVMTALVYLIIDVAAAGTITGVAKRQGKRNHENIVIYVEKVGDHPFQPPKGESILDQINLTFVPHVMPILVGSTVNFPNSDKVRHNVFSPSKTKKFNLGTYSVRTTKSVTFEKAGLVVLLCNVHTEMSAFVLALHGQLSRSDLQWLVSRLKQDAITPDNIKLAVANTMTRAAMTRVVQPSTALAVLRDLPEVALDAPAAWWRFGHSFLSREAAFAAKLYTQALVGDKTGVPAVLLLLDKLAEQRYASTHTIAWTLLAVDEIFAAADAGTRATVHTPLGETHELRPEIGRNQVGGKLPTGTGRGVAMTNASPEKSLFGYVTYRGWPLQPPKAGFEHQIVLSRFYMHEDGTLLIPPFSVAQGQRIFVGLLARHLVEGVDSLSNVAVEDWLPAGFEIENPRLLTEDALPQLPQQFMQIDFWKTDYVDYLDDKIAVFGTLHRDPRVFVFSVRAVSQGTFQLMPSTAEAMYMPELRALTVEDNQITVTPPK